MTRTQEAWIGRKMLYWMATQWCNYKCRYCRQDHSRKQEYRGGKGHWIDNRPLVDWIEHTARHFADSDTTVVITGGEFMLDAKHAWPMLESLASWAECIRVDTNGSWHPSVCRWNNVHLMLSYHPSEISLQDFVAKLDALLDLGWSVEVVNLVVLNELIPRLPHIAAVLQERDVPLSVAFAYGTTQYYSPDEVDAINRYVPEKDQYYRMGGNTRGGDCLFPSLSYQMDPDGSLCVACHPQLAGAIWDARLPSLFDGYTQCPHDKCTCTDMYTFAKDIDVNVGVMPLLDYSTRVSLL